MNRRGFLRTALCAAGATASAMAVGKVEAREPDMVHGTLVTGPDPSTYVYVEWTVDSRVLVIPPHAHLWSQNSGVSVQGMGIPRAEFPEFDAKHGAVTLFEPNDGLILPAEWTVPMIRAHYLYALGQRTPNAPIDGNHLSVRFMPRALYTVLPRIDGEDAKHVTESYSGPNGWLVQMVADARGPILFGDALRYRIVTGNVALWVDGAVINPGDYTAPLLP